MPPTLANAPQGISEGGEQRDRYGRIRDLKMAAQVPNFLQENNISTLLELQEKVTKIQTRYDNVREIVLFDNNYELLHDRIDIRAVSPITEKEYFNLLPCLR